MECNRDEAIRARTIAEKKMADKDYAVAKKLILKAQTLYPDFDGISQMLITLNVYISSENKVNGESDWYGILDVNPSDDDKTIRKQYRKMALMLHPDKNKSAGADGAFMILSEAWSLLSDKAKRSAYNQRRKSRGFQQKAPSQRGSANRATNGAAPASVPNRVHPWVPARAAAPVVHRADTFWTICHRCKMHYEYLKMYVNLTLLCPKCHKPFFAAEMAAPINYPKPGHLSSHLQHQNSSNYPANCRPTGNIHCGPSRMNVSGNSCPPAASKAADVQRVNDRLRRDRADFDGQRGSKRRK